MMIKAGNLGRFWRAGAGASLIEYALLLGVFGAGMAAVIAGVSLTIDTTWRELGSVTSAGRGQAASPATPATAARSEHSPIQVAIGGPVSAVDAGDAWLGQVEPAAGGELVAREQARAIFEHLIGGNSQSSSAARTGASVLAKAGPWAVTLYLAMVAAAMIMLWRLTFFGYLVGPRRVPWRRLEPRRSTRVFAAGVGGPWQPAK